MKTITKILLGGAMVITGYYLIKIVTGASDKITNSLGQEWSPETENIQIAWDSLGGSEGWVFFPKNFVFNTATSLSIPNNLTLYGNGCTIKALPNSNIVPGVIQNTDKLTGNNIHIYNLTVDGNCMEQTPFWAQYNQDPVGCRKNNFLWSPDCASAGYAVGDIGCINQKHYIVQNIYTPPEVYLAWVYLDEAPGCPDDIIGHCTNHHTNKTGMHAGFFRNLTNSSFTGCRFLNGSSSCVYYYNAFGLSDDGNILFDGCEFAGAGAWLEGTNTLDCGHHGIYGAANGIKISNSVAHDCYADGFVIEYPEYAQNANPLAYVKNWLISNCISYACTAGYWAELAGPGVMQDCEAYNMHKYESYGEEFAASGFVIGSNSFNIQHLRCKAHDIEWRGFSGNGWHDIIWQYCESYDIDCNGPYEGGGFILGGKNTTDDQMTPIGNFSVLDCDIHDIHAGGTYGRGIEQYMNYNPIILRNSINGCQNNGIHLRTPADNQSGEVAYNMISNYGGQCISSTGVIGVNIHDNSC